MTNLLVAVDGSEANKAALGWAIDTAARRGEVLSILVIVEDPWQVPDRDPPHGSEQSDVQPIVDGAVEVATARLRPEQVDTLVVAGPALSVLVHLAANHSALVMGRRGLGAISRILIGSTSIAVAGRSSVPVTIVPETWDYADAGSRPVVLGLDMEEEHDAAVRYAFTEAKARGVSLQVLQGWRPPATPIAMPGAQVAYYDGWRNACLASLKVYIERMGREIPEVDVSADQVIGHPIDILVDGAEDAQLLVLGRDEKARWTGFALGSVARNVLPLSKVPVTIVPADSAGA
jgi:nucleotide-binding universal stress UspA family protein